MTPEQAAARFVDLFHQVYLRFHDRRPARDRALSLEAMAVLEHLSRTGPLTVTETARHLGRSQAATSEILARLERRGLLATFADERDRRRHLVWLSDAGLAAWRRSQRVLSEALLAGAFIRLPERARLGAGRARAPAHRDTSAGGADAVPRANENFLHPNQPGERTMTEADSLRCSSCTMPIESGSLCRFCGDEHGELRPFDELFPRMLQWTLRHEPALPRAQAERKTLEFMATMPAWRDCAEIKTRLEGRPR